MRLDPIEAYILESFRQKSATSLTFDEIVAESTTCRRDTLKEAMSRLEGEHALVRHIPRGDRIELTAAGRHYLNL